VLLHRPGPARQAIIRACKADPLFYINSFLWVDNAIGWPPCSPVITWEDQERLVRILHRNVLMARDPRHYHERFDVHIDKSREVGGTIIVLAFLDWLWRFNLSTRIHCISAKAEKVDSKEDPSALFPKLDYYEERLPNAMALRGRNHSNVNGRAMLKIINHKTGSVITGEASSNNAGRSGRYLVALRDEEAACENGAAISGSLADTTRMQIRLSTPKGSNGSFYAGKLKKSIEHISLHWSRDPRKALGLYSIKGGQVKVLDAKWHEENPGHRFVVAPTDADPGVPWEFLRSPYFDNKQESADSHRDVAENQQISYLGSGSPFFEAERVEILRVKNCREPVWSGNVGELVVGAAKIEDRDIRHNRCRIWFAPTLATKLPPQDTTYTIGADISAGSGASDSTVSVGDDRSKVKVLEFMTNGIAPESFAKLVAKLCEYFTTPLGKPYLSWDQGGHGIAFGTEIQSHAVLMHHHVNVDGEPAKHPGIPSAKQTKYAVFMAYRAAFYENVFVTHSQETYRQLSEFVYDGSTGATPGIAHQASKATEDDADRGDQHGDIVTSEVVLWAAMAVRPMPIPEKKIIPYGSIAWRMQQQQQADANKSMFRPGNAKSIVYIR